MTTISLLRCISRRAPGATGSNAYMFLNQLSRSYSARPGLPHASRCPCMACSSRRMGGAMQSRTYATSKHGQASRRTVKKLPSVPSVPDSMKKIFEGNKLWAREANARDPLLFRRMAAGQSPKYLYFGCSDSRVPATDILGLRAGEVFVHRNVGALVPGNDLNALSVLEYAVAHLGVTDIIVAGHYDCGAIRAASSNQDLGMLENWLRLIRDTYRLHKDQLNTIEDPEERHKRLVELNVTEQCMNLYKTSVVQKRLAATVVDEAVPRIHGTVFDQSTGLLKYLDIDFESLVSDVNPIYSLGHK